MVALKKYHDVSFDVFLIKGRGFIGYFSNIGRLRKKIKDGNYDLVHAHFSLSGFVSLLACKIPVVITFHGSDINEWNLNILSSITALWADHVIFVSGKMFHKVLIKTSNISIVPCGVDFDQFYPQPKAKAMLAEGLDPDTKYILFSSSFRIRIKNPSLAKRAINLLDDKVKMIDLSGRTRDEVRNLINASDLLLMTSYSEGSPQIVKEAMACNCPIVSTEVGDVREVIANTQGCYITTFNPADVAEKIQKAIGFGKPTNGRANISHLDNRIIANRIFEVYKKVRKI